MPNTKSAEHRMRNSARRHLHNQSIKSRLKTLEKKFLTLLTGAKKDETIAAWRAHCAMKRRTPKCGCMDGRQVIAPDV